MKKFVLTAAVLISLLGFTACEQSPTEVTVQAPSQASEFKEVKWIGMPTYFNYLYIDGCLKLKGIDSVKAIDRYGYLKTYTTNHDQIICDYIKIMINSAEPNSISAQYGDVTVIFKPVNSSAECVKYFSYSSFPDDYRSYLQWEYK